MSSLTACLPAGQWLPAPGELEGAASDGLDPLLDATPRNGCMQVVRRRPPGRQDLKHSCCVGGTWCASHQLLHSSSLTA